ncbi:MAG: hypothetical protein KHY19_16895 [Coprobacillus cateniformis]|nr:hypothetical protein [Coprobacillus cateniformis]
MSHNKNFPRIYSLSTVGIRNHYNSDYRFHPFRTDFVGDSGVGKSIIADVLQLILVGEREFKSATDSSSEREARKLIIERYGYVFLNIAINTGQFIVIGMYISATSIDPFIIQANIGLDMFEPLSSPIISKDFMSGDEIIDIIDLPKRMKESKQAYAVKLTLNKYHELLEQNNILPINLKTEGNLKTFAQIIRAFSRGKGFKNNSRWLKEFFFNDDLENIIKTRFDEQLADIAQELRDHKENKETLENVRIKYEKFKRLFDLKKARDAAQEDYLKTKIIFHYQNRNAAERKYVQFQDGIKNINHKVANLFFCLFSAETEEQQRHINSLADKLSIIENAQKNITTYLTKEFIAFQKYPKLNEQYIQVQKVEELLNTYKTCEKLRERHSKQLIEKEEKEYLKNLSNELKEQRLYEEWIKSPWVKGTDAGYAFCKKRTEEINTEIKRLTTLKNFTDITNTKSLAYWTIHNKPSLSHEQESVLFNLDAIFIEKPVNIKKNVQYIPKPETFFSNLKIDEKESNPNGFWVDWGGIKRFVPYISERFFTMKNSDEIVGYFNEKYKDAEKIINSLRKEKETIEAMQKVASKYGENAVNAFIRRDEISAYIIDENLDITTRQLDELLIVYFNGEDIKQTKSELDIAKDKKLKGEIEQEQVKKDIQQVCKIEFSEKDYFIELQTAIRKLYEKANRSLLYKQNRKNRFLQLFSTYIQSNRDLETKSILNIRSELNDNLKKKHSFKEEIKVLRTKIKEEDYLYHQAELEYQANSGQQVNLETNIEVSPEEKKQLFDSVKNAYKEAYDDIVIKFLSEKKHQRFIGSEDYMALTREVVNEIPAK